MSDTLVSPGSDVSDEPPAPSNPSSGGGGIKSWSPGKKIGILGGGGVVFLMAVYLYAKHKSATASTSSTTSGSNSTTPTLVLPSSNQDALGSSNYAGLTAGLGSLANQVSALQTSQVPPPPPPPPPTPQPTPTPTPTPAPTPAHQYAPLTQNALDYNLFHNQNFYQSGVEAINWDESQGIAPTGIDPNAYYALSTGAANNLFSSGQPVYGQVA